MDTKTAVIKWRESKQDDGFRPHLGASLIGHECSRHLWYVFRLAKQANFDGRLLRLFDTGHREEPRVLEELRGIGCEVYDRTEDGKQVTFTAEFGHFSGSLDGMVKGLPEDKEEWHVLEIKTHGEKSFNDVLANGVEKSKPQHYAQMQIYMGYMGLTKALYYPVNKNTDDIAPQIVDFDKSAFDRLVEKAKYIVFAVEPPGRMSEDPTFYKCKFCDHHSICHGNDVPKPSCRTCAHVTPTEKGTWTCSLYDDFEIDFDNQKTGCESHRYIPTLLSNFAEVVNANGEQNWVQYKNKLNGNCFTNGDDTANSFPSHQIWIAEKAMLGDSFVSEVKEMFPGSKFEINDEDIPF